MKILIVDDNSALLQSLKLALEDSYNVFIFNSGHDVLAALDIIHPDVILTDYEMPGMNGVELVKLIRLSCPVLPVILMSAVLSQSLINKAEEAGAQLCLSKLSGLNELKESLRKVI